MYIFIGLVREDISLRALASAFLDSLAGSCKSITDVASYARIEANEMCHFHTWPLKTVSTVCHCSSPLELRYCILKMVKQKIGKIMVSRSLFRGELLANQEHLIWAAWATDNFPPWKANKSWVLLASAIFYIYIITSLSLSCLNHDLILFWVIP